MIDGTMYINTPLGRVIALDATTGRERWVFDPETARDVPYGDFPSRGVVVWTDASRSTDASCHRRILETTAQSQMFALDARDGRPCHDFAAGGPIDLTKGPRIPPFEPWAYSMTSAPIVVNGVVITGSSIADNRRPAPASGEVRGFDARTGQLKWSWDPIPQNALDPADGEWRGSVGVRSGGANAWSDSSPTRSATQCPFPPAARPTTITA